MSYITSEELYVRYRVFDTSSATSVNSDYIYYAEREIEGLLSPAFSVPFDTPCSPTIKDLVIDMCYARWLQRTFNNKAKDFRKNLLERIKGIVKGDESIMTGSGTMETSTRAKDLPTSTTEDYYPTHTILGSENEYTHVDSQYLYDLENERS